MRLRRLLGLLGVLFVFGVSQTAKATDRFYPDQTVLSPDGRYRLEAKSPDNVRGPAPFAADFVYTLFDAATGDVLWQRAQPDDEASPMALHLHNDGWVAVWTGWHHLVVLDAVTAERIVDLDILESFTQEERDAHVHQTTAGPMWAAMSRWYYLDVGSDTFFVIRPGWGRRIIVSIPDGAMLPSDDAHLVPLCRAAERAFVLETLDGAADRIASASDDERWGLLDSVQTAVLLAAQNGEHSALDELRRLEQQANFPWATGAHSIEVVAYSELPLEPFAVQVNRTRFAAQMALRCLGERPANLPSTFATVGTSWTDQRYAIPEPLSRPREEGAGEVRAGMTTTQIIGAVGMPDAAVRGLWVWDYHMDASPPYTLRLHFATGPQVRQVGSTVGRVERIQPALWQRDNSWFEALR